jgi:hypothetical protein
MFALAYNEDFYSDVDYCHPNAGLMQERNNVFLIKCEVIIFELL